MPPSELIVPPFFPLVRGDCDKVAAVFFGCVDEVFPKPQPGTCSDSKQGYEKCMKSYFAKNPKDQAILPEYIK
jgi:hypothetical protein